MSLVLAGLDGSRSPLAWDQAGFPYLVTVTWDHDVPLIVVQSRDQRRMLLLSADPATGATAVLRDDTDDRWLDIVPGVPAGPATAGSSGPPTRAGPGGCWSPARRSSPRASRHRSPP